MEEWMVLEMRVAVVSRQQGLDGFLAHLLGQKTGLGCLLAALQQLRRPEIVLGLQQPQPGAMARPLQAHGKQLPASSGIASARTERQNGASPWRASNCGEATSGCSGSGADLRRPRQGVLRKGAHEALAPRLAHREHRFFEAAGQSLGRSLERLAGAGTSGSRPGRGIDALRPPRMGLFRCSPGCRESSQGPQPGTGAASLGPHPQPALVGPARADLDTRAACRPSGPHAAAVWLHHPTR